MKKFFPAFAALTLIAAPVEAGPSSHTILNPDGSAFVCHFRSNTTRCFDMKREQHLKSQREHINRLTEFNSCLDSLGGVVGSRNLDTRSFDECSGLLTSEQIEEKAKRQEELCQSWLSSSAYATRQYLSACQYSL